MITSCVHVCNLHLGANVHPGANLLHCICTTYKGGANSHLGANLHPGVFSLSTVYMTKRHPRCKFTPRVYICTGVYIVHMTRLNTSLGTCAHDFEPYWYSNNIEHKSACTKYSMRGKKGKYGLFRRN